MADQPINQANASRSAPRLLFVPVSGAYGMGEYARCLAIAGAADRRWRGAAIHFVLSRLAPYAHDVPFPATLLASSPTFHSAEVIALIEKLRPEVVIFDNAGRTAQLRAARRCGARVVFISARPRQRRRAFRWHWMRLIDEHWIAYPEFVAGGLRFFERLKLRMAGRPVVRYLDVILSRADPAQRGTVPCAASAACSAGSYVLVIPGGGTGHPAAAQAIDRFAAAAKALALRGVPTVFVAPTDTAGNAAGAVREENWHPLGPLPQAELGQLMRSARLIVANGGSTLLQAIACGCACIAVPIAHDQIERARRCAAARVAVISALDTACMVEAAESLLQDEAQRAALARRAADLELADGIETAMQALADMLDGACRAPQG